MRPTLLGSIVQASLFPTIHLRLDCRHSDPLLSCLSQPRCTCPHLQTGQGPIDHQILQKKFSQLGSKINQIGQVNQKPSDKGSCL